MSGVPWFGTKQVERRLHRQHMRTEAAGHRSTEYVTTVEGAKLLGISPHLFNMLCKQFKIPHRLVGIGYRYDPVLLRRIRTISVECKVKMADAIRVWKALDEGRIA